MIHIRLVPTGPWDICFGRRKGGTELGVALSGSYLLSGPPGSGKSTMTLQICEEFGQIFEQDTLIIGAEEDTGMMRDRGERMGLGLKRTLVLAVTRLDAVVTMANVLAEVKPCLVVVDSLSTLFQKDLDAAVNMAQHTNALSKALKIPFINLNHVTKTDDFAGPMTLQHAVDGTLTMYPLEDPLRPPTEEPPRALRSIKNRFGIATVVRLEMTEQGIMPGLTEEEARAKWGPAGRQNAKV